MKKLLIGNHAVAQGLYEGGIGFASGYPGTPSTEIMEKLATYTEVNAEWAPNEKVALEAVFGASLAGVRAACTMKHVGLNVAADALFTFSYTGVNGGAVICVADDPAMHSSQNEQDSRHYAIAAKLPMLEPADSEEALSFAKMAFELSEKFDTPVLFRMTTRTAHGQSFAEIGERAEVAPIPYKKNPQKYLMMPAFAKGKHPLVEERLNKLRKYGENCPFNRVEWGGTDMGIITSGVCYQYVKEVFGDSVSVLKLGMVHPLPTKLIEDFAKSVKRLVVVEELDGIIEAHCNSLGLFPEGKSLFSPIGELSQGVIQKVLKGETAPQMPTPDGVLPRPPMMCAGCPHRGIFYLLHQLRLTVIGDIGCYTLGVQPPLSAMDSLLCMGASVSGLHGFLKARPEMADQTVAVIGDSTFVHSGITSLIDIAYHQTPATVIVLDNSITGMTGHQQNPASGFDIYGEPATQVNMEALCHSIGIRRVRVVDPYDLAASKQVIVEELTAKEPSVIIARRPCVLLKTVKHNPPLLIAKEDCRGCKRCMSLGCPALSMDGSKVKIDATLCVGCGVCQKLCSFGAIQQKGQE